MLQTNLAESYFTAHLGGVFWAELPETSRHAALSMAAHDVAAALGREIDAANERELAAGFEQALHLARHYDEICKARQLLSETVDGAGAATYAPGNIILAPRAEWLLRQEPGAEFRFSRG